MKKKLIAIALCLLVIVPAFAVFNEKNCSQTISVLRHELHLILQDKKEQSEKKEDPTQMAEVRHREMVQTIKRINELTLILFSQEKDCTLDQTYAMDCVKEEYDKFNKRKKPQYTSIETIDSEIERYQRLIESLRMLPPKLDVIEEVPDTLRQQMEVIDTEFVNISFLLDSLLMALSPDPQPVIPSDTVVSTVKKNKSIVKELATYGWVSKRNAADTTDNNSYILPEQAQADRDSCIAYAREIVHFYIEEKERIEEDEHYFTEMYHRLQQSYEYSKTRYKEIQDYIFITGQENYFNVLSNFSSYAADATADMKQKYGTGDNEQDKAGLQESQWRGFDFAGILIYALFHLLVISIAVFLLFCVILRKAKPFNTEKFKQSRPVFLLLAVSVIYCILILISCFFPMSNSMEVAVALGLVYLWFMIALLLSIIIGLKSSDAGEGLKGFMPVLVLGMLLMTIRALFIPDKMINLTLSPTMAVFFIWQIAATRRFSKKCSGYKGIIRLHYITTVTFGFSLLCAIEGYPLCTLMFIMWWIFQVATLATLTSTTYLMRYYEKNKMSEKKEKYAASHRMVSKDEDGDFIRVTWLYDLVYRVVIPVTGILSVLGCIYLAFGVFNLGDTSKLLLHKSFFDFKNADGNPILQVSLFKLALVSVCFFIFRYINYLSRAIYRTNKFEKVMKKSGNDFVRKNDVNLTLAYNIIGIIIWGLFTLYAIDILKIPIAALSLVAAGLATGIGLALKDVLNNFIYGIQLMSGRLRVGDMLECDDIRGTVEKISYQSTEIQTLSGAVISFTNSTLFNKNFQNLTKNSPYEFVSIVVSISYGEDVERVRELILDAMDGYKKKKDKYGRYIIDRKIGIWISLDSFGDSSVNLAIKQNVLVESKTYYAADVKELVYKLFNDNGIVIPFPQQEVSILNFNKDNQ